MKMRIVIPFVFAMLFASVLVTQAFSQEPASCFVAVTAYDYESGSKIGAFRGFVIDSTTLTGAGMESNNGVVELRFDIGEKYVRVETSEFKTTVLRVPMVCDDGMYRNEVSVPLWKGEKTEFVNIRRTDRPERHFEDELPDQWLSEKVKLRKKENESNGQSGLKEGKAIHLPVPAYPAKARSLGIIGVVEVEVLINKKGEVTSARVVSGPDELHSSALEAAKRTRYEITTINGEPIEMMKIISFNFKP